MDSARHLMSRFAQHSGSGRVEVLIAGTEPDQENRVRLTSAITGILVISVIVTDGAKGQSSGVHCERRAPLVATTDTSPVTDASRFTMDSMARSCPDPARLSHIDPMPPSRLRVLSGIGAAAAVAQAIDSPEQWPRTTVGLLQRLADRSGAVAIQALTYHAVSQRLGWVPDQVSCPTGALARAQCAIASTLVVRNAHGAPRPDVARLAGLTLGSAASLLWRPERRSGGDAALFVLTRVGSGLAFTALRHAVARRRPSGQH